VPGYPFVSRNITTEVLNVWSSSNNKFSMQFEGRKNDGAGHPQMYIYFSDWSWSTSFGIYSLDWTKKETTFTMPDPSGHMVALVKVMLEICKYHILHLIKIFIMVY